MNEQIAQHLITAQPRLDRDPGYSDFNQELRVTLRTGELLSHVALQNERFQEVAAHDIATVFRSRANDPDNVFDFTPEQVLLVVETYVGRDGPRQIVGEAIRYLKVNPEMFNGDTELVMGSLKNLHKTMVKQKTLTSSIQGESKE